MTPLRAHIHDPDPLEAEPAAKAAPDAEPAPRRYARPNRPPTPETLTIPLAGVAAMLGISMRTLERMIAIGDFPRPIRVGKQRMYRRSSVERWLEAAEAEAARSPRGRRR
jgi:excisionase family DNA binding protein